MERHCGNVHGLLEEVVVHIGVRPSLADIRGHGHSVKDEVELTAEMLHRSVHESLEICHRRSVGGDDDGAALLREAVDLAQADGYGSIGKDDFSSFGYGEFRDLPCDGFVVQCSEYEALAAFQKLVCHILFLWYEIE